MNRHHPSPITPRPAITALPKGRPQPRRLALSALGAGLAGLAGLWAGPAAAAAPGAPDALQAALEKLLRNKPELVRDAMQQLERREAEARVRQEQQALQQQAPALQRLAGSTVLGNPAGDVTLVEFVDYRCGHCKHLSASIDELIAADPQLRVLVKHLPILGPDSTQAAQLVLGLPPGALARQVHQALMAADTLDGAALQAIEDRFSLVPSPVGAANQGLADVRVLADRLGIQGTPALVVGRSLFRGALPSAPLAAAVQLARQQAAGRPTPARVS